MKLIIFSDIHGNSYALDAFLEQIKEIPYDYAVFCGDIFGYYYNQKEIIWKLSQMRQLIWLKGNHDEYALNIYRGTCSEKYYVEQYGHSYADIQERFSQSEMDLLKSHGSEFIFCRDHCRVGIFHGTPDNSLEGRLYPDKPVRHAEAYERFDYVVLGHTHCRMLRQVGRTLVLNSGSLGQPRDGWGYGFAVLDTTLKQVEFYTVGMDSALLYSQIERYDPDLGKLKEVLERKRQ